MIPGKPCGPAAHDRKPCDENDHAA
jgi:hypothetical protein